MSALNMKNPFVFVGYLRTRGDSRMNVLSWWRPCDVITDPELRSDSDQTLMDRQKTSTSADMMKMQTRAETQRTRVRTSFRFSISDISLRYSCVHSLTRLQWRCTAPSDLWVRLLTLLLSISKPIQTPAETLWDPSTRLRNLRVASASPGAQTTDANATACRPATRWSGGASVCPNHNKPAFIYRTLSVSPHSALLGYTYSWP